MNKKQILGLILVLFLHEAIQLILFFWFSLYDFGWENMLAKRIIIALIILFPIPVFLAYKIKNSIFDKIINLLNWSVLLLAIFFALFKPFVTSVESYELYLSQGVNILNPGISLSYIIYLSTLFILIIRSKRLSLKKVVFLYSPYILWILIRLFFMK